MGKGENACNQYFLLFPQYFVHVQKQISNFQQHLSSANAFNLDQSKNVSFGKELNLRLLSIMLAPFLGSLDQGQTVKNVHSDL